MRKRLLGIGLATALGASLVAAPVTAQDESPACAAIADAVGFIMAIDNRVTGLLAQVNAAFNGDAVPDGQLLISRARLLGCKL